MKSLSVFTLYYEVVSRASITVKNKKYIILLCSDYKNYISNGLAMIDVEKRYSSAHSVIMQLGRPNIYFSAAFESSCATY